MIRWIVLTILPLTIFAPSIWGEGTVNPVLTILGHELNVKKTFGEDELFKPQQIIASGDEIFILDRGDETVKVYSKEGVYKTKIGGRGTGPGQVFFALNFDIANGKIFILDTMRQQIHMYLKDTRKYLHSKLYSLIFKGYSPHSIAVSQDEMFYFNTMVSVKGAKVITRLNTDLKSEFAFLDCIPVYKNENELRADKTSSPKWAVNLGHIDLDANKVYFTYLLINKVLEFSKDGKMLNKYTLPLTSIDKTVKIIRFSNGSEGLKRRLNYDLKIRNHNIYVLSRDETGNSILFELRDGAFKEIYRMKEELFGFEISGDKLYGIHDGEEGIYIYNLK